MAALHVLFRDCSKGALLFTRSLQRRREYARKINEEDLAAYRKFRKQLTAHRRKFMDEWKEEKRKEDELNLERDRIDRENERIQSKSIAGKDEQLKVIRNAYYDAKEKRVDERRERGDAIREEIQAKRTALYKQQIDEITEEMKGFVTFENLDEKVQEAIDNIHYVTFALDKSGKIIEDSLSSNKTNIYHFDYHEFINSITPQDGVLK